MSITIFLRKQIWFVLAAIALFLGVLFTGVFATGSLLFPMLHVEQWLLLRPITRADCVLTQWARLGDADITLGLTCVLGVVCLLLGYRKRVLPYLLLLFLLGVGIELVGKYTLPQRIPGGVQTSLDALHCPSLEHQPRSTRYLVTLGAWWIAPPVPPQRIEQARQGAAAPLVFDAEAQTMYSYPSGHATRWSLLGLLACWLCAYHVRRRLLRRILMLLTILIAFGGGFTLFYIGYHYGTDLIAGYLLGISSACCMIGLLVRNRKRNVSLAVDDKPIGTDASRLRRSMANRT